MVTTRINPAVAVLAAAVIGALVVGLIVVATSRDDSITGSGSGPSQNPEHAFLNELDASAPTLQAKLGDDRLITLGRQSCDLVRSGGSFGEAETAMTNHGLTADEASALTFAARADFCPTS